MSNVDKLLLRNYINLCKYIPLELISDIIDDIDNNYNIDYISYKYNLLDKEIHDIYNLMNRYQPNHKDTLLEIYQQYHILLGGNKTDDKTKQYKSSILSSLINPNTTQNENKISINDVINALSSGDTDKIKDVVKELSKSAALSATQALVALLDSKLVSLEKQITDQIKSLTTKVQNTIDTSVKNPKIKEAVEKSVKQSIDNSLKTIDKISTNAESNINNTANNILDNKVNTVIDHTFDKITIGEKISGEKK